MKAVISNHEDVVMYLLSKGADVMARDYVSICLTYLILV